MVAGHLQEKNDTYYIILELRYENGKRYNKWISTKLKVRGNKRKAEAMLQEARKKYSIDYKPEVEDILFSDLLLSWLPIVKPKLAVTTYASYETNAKKIIVPYFAERKIKLSELKASDLDRFYTKQSERVKQRTVLHYHALIHKVLKYAVKNKMIAVNPADNVDRPRAAAFEANFYNSGEMEKLFKAAKDTLLEIPVLLGAFYGLRRSEVVGLKWKAIDFDANTITIRHTVTSCYVGGKHVQIAKDRAKNDSSMRTLPLVAAMKERLLVLQAQQKEYKRVCGSSYDTGYKEYICVDQLGQLIKPEYITDNFPILLERNGLRRIRFHDLRHSCASLLLANGVPMKQIQEWLGHSDFSTTANIYSHLEYSAKLSSANAMASGLSDALSILS